MGEIVRDLAHISKSISDILSILIITASSDSIKSLSKAGESHASYTWDQLRKNNLEATMVFIRNILRSIYVH